MEIHYRNKKIAINRWNSRHKKELRLFRRDTKARALKAAICGFLAGDGSVQIRREKTFFHFQIDFYPDDLLMRDKYLEAMSYVYNKKPTIFRRKNFDELRLTSKTVVLDLKKYADFGTHNWVLPNKLLTDEEAITCWLKAFFSAEAYVGPKHIKIQTVNKKGMAEVARLLQRIGICHKVYMYRPKVKNHSDVTAIFISKKDSRLHFKNKIGFWHSRKSNKLRDSLDF
ncbi:LAGLIDADG family homing endonuclease [Nanoarchaeota archaeon]